MRSITTVWIFQVTNKQNLRQEDLDMAKNLQRETESLLIAAQNNAIKTIYVQAKIDSIQQNRKCGLCRDRDKAINHK